MRTQIQSIYSVIFLVLLLSLASCNMPAPQTTPTMDSNAVLTEAAMTVAAQLTLSAGQTPSATPTAPAPPAATTAPVQSPEIVETATPQVQEATNPPVSDPGTTSSADAATFITDVTVPDGTGAVPGAVFNKVWRVKNTGTTTWSTAYSLVWIEGEKMNAPDSVAIPNEVKPGETVDITIQLTAPSEAGTYQTFFRLRNADGQFFKLDTSGDLWIKIVVGANVTNTPGAETPTATPTP